MLINASIFFVGLVLFFGCRNDNQDKVKEIRIYQVDGSMNDSIWYDSLSTVPSPENNLSKLIHGVDSGLARTKNYFNLDAAITTIVGYDEWQDVKLIKYVVELPVGHGYLSFYGIYAENIGTVYWRTLDGKKSLRLQAKQLADQRYIYADLLSYLDSTALARPPRPIYNEDEAKKEVEGLELDTTFKKHP